VPESHWPRIFRPRGTEAALADLTAERDALAGELAVSRAAVRALASEGMQAANAVNFLSQALAAVLLQQEAEAFVLSAALYEAAGDCPAPRIRQDGSRVVIDFPPDAQVPEGAPPCRD
jgi:hypothetical protein